MLARRQRENRQEAAEERDRVKLNEDSAIPLARSPQEPPKYVDHKTELPSGESFAKNPSRRLQLGGGTAEPSVVPETYADPEASTVIASPESLPVVPRYSE